jgi:phenylacetate-CoA ligase
VIPFSYAIAGRNSLGLLHELESNQKLSKDEVTGIQLGKLKRLVKHAYDHVPFYRKRFAEVGAKPEDIQGLEDYERLPLLTKRDLREHLEEIVARNFDKRTLVYSSTGGSTGVPVNYYHDTRYMFEVSAAGMWRAWAWAGIKPGDRHFYVWGGPREIDEAQSFSWRLKHWLLRRVFLDAFNLTGSKLEWAAHRAQTFRPKFIYGYTSGVTAFAKYVLSHYQPLSGVRAAMTTAERLLPEQREIINSAFGCRVFDQFACREVRSVASECEDGSLHINTDLNVVEFINHPRNYVNNLKMLVLTPLELYGFPLLRYINEDCATPGKPCSCGLPFPTLTLQIGRISDNFTLPSGRIVHGEYFTHLIYGIEGIRQFQFHQVAHDRIIFQVVPNTINDTTILAELKVRIGEAEAYLGEGCRIELREVTHIPMSASGKHRFTLSDVTPDWLSTNFSENK